MKRIIGIGNALVDALYRIDSPALLAELGLAPGGMTLIDAARYAQLAQRLRDFPCERATGGAACNTILALARLGAQPGVIGTVGRDDAGHFFSKRCLDAGISTHFSLSEQPTGVATTFITPDGARTFATHLGAAAEMDADSIPAAWFTGYRYLYIEGYLVQNPPLITRVMETAHRAGLKVCLDLASYNIVNESRALFDRLLSLTDLVFANEEEAHAFTDCAPQQAVQRLAERCEVAVVKCGAGGALACRGDVCEGVTAVAVDRVVDTTAAGDFFAAGFLYAYAEGRSLKRCLAGGALMASEVIRVMGTQLTETTWARLRNELTCA